MATVLFGFFGNFYSKLRKFWSEFKVHEIQNGVSVYLSIKQHDDFKSR